MHGVLNIGVKRRLVFESHDAAECVALAAGRDVGANVGLEQAGDLPLKSGYILRGLGFLRFGDVRLPLKCEYVKDVLCLAFSRGLLRESGWEKRCG